MTFVFKLHGMWHHSNDFRNRQVCRDPSFVESNLRRRFKICIFEFARSSQEPINAKIFTKLRPNFEACESCVFFPTQFQISTPKNPSFPNCLTFAARKIFFLMSVSKERRIICLGVSGL